ncbi:60S ribosomal protein L13 [Anaeramoeba ignava]|uniref:60S ribosomal protein L13 n=1 Tax=Anaeramoeba ignava TaxID=1746090 RepID=A0A9Q0LZ02_ANAIG|nr:60S ribosomal protein L13 [Anaeramoeba ignava]
MPNFKHTLPNVHLHKDWKSRVKTWFDQPGRKKRRRMSRLKKAARVAPRPINGPLRPLVHSQTVRYNMRVRAGRGFTFQELKEAGIHKKFARSIGISVDHRRMNRSEQSLRENVERLKEYKANLILFPRRKGKFKNGDSKKEDLKLAKQIKYTPTTKTEPEVIARKITDRERKAKVWKLQRMNNRAVRSIIAKKIAAKQLKRKQYRMQKKQEQKQKQDPKQKKTDNN